MHTFLFTEARWNSQGSYWDANGREMAAVGETHVSHGTAVWVVEGRIRIFGDTPVELMNSYSIDPSARGQDFLRWISYNPAIGEMHGVFSVVSDSIISLFATKDGRYSGSEFLLQIDNSTYTNRGVFFSEGKQLTRWAVELKRTK